MRGREAGARRRSATVALANRVFCVSVDGSNREQGQDCDCGGGADETVAFLARWALACTFHQHRHADGGEDGKSGGGQIHPALCTNFTRDRNHARRWRQRDEERRCQKADRRPTHERDSRGNQERNDDDRGPRDISKR